MATKLDRALKRELSIEGKPFVVTLTPEGHALRGRCAIRDPRSLAIAASAKPAAVFAFDLLQLEGKDLRHLPLEHPAKPIKRFAG